MKTFKRAVAVGLVILALSLTAIAADTKGKNQKLHNELNKMKKQNIELEKKNKKLKKGLEKKAALAKKTPEPVKEWLSNPPTGAIYSGAASWYGSESGSVTASGERFNPNGLTAAMRVHRGKRARVTNLANGKSVVVRINDYGPASWTGRVIDLSKGAFQEIGSLSSGVVRVKVEIVA